MNLYLSIEAEMSGAENGHIEDPLFFEGDDMNTSDEDFIDDTTLLSRRNRNRRNSSETEESLNKRIQHQHPRTMDKTDSPTGDLVDRDSPSRDDATEPELR